MDIGRRNLRLLKIANPPVTSRSSDEFPQTVFVGDVGSVHANLPDRQDSSDTSISSLGAAQQGLHSILVPDGNFTLRRTER